MCIYGVFKHVASSPCSRFSNLDHPRDKSSSHSAFKSSRERKKTLNLGWAREEHFLILYYFLSFSSISLNSSCAWMVNNGIPFPADHKPCRGFTHCRCAQYLFLCIIPQFGSTNCATGYALAKPLDSRFAVRRLQPALVTTCYKLLCSN